MTVHDYSKDSFEGAMASLNLPPVHTPLACSHMDYTQLARTKRSLEAALGSLFDLLARNNCDMDLPLVVDGFPRADIDVVTVRLLRTRIICLRNDLRTVIDQILRHLEQRLAPGAEPPVFGFEDPAVDVDSTITNQARVPFAVVRGVVEHSPASKAGLHPGDEIWLFGTVDALNNDRLRAVAAHVQQKQDQDVLVRVLRQGQPVDVLLHPTADWSGQGLLGCQIAPR